MRTRSFLLAFALAALTILAAGCSSSSPGTESPSPDSGITSDTPPPSASEPTDTLTFEKPVVYLYPPQEMLVDVRLDVDGAVTLTDPALGQDDTWHVRARPSGELIDLQSGQRFPYLFWEAEMPAVFDMPSGTVVEGKATRAFLRDSLADLGLNDTESSAFMEYLVPELEHHPYNLIRFEGLRYTSRARLHVVPEPDTVIRVFMTYAPLDSPVPTEPQVLPQAPERRGFVLVEWGGTQVPPR